MKNRIIYTHEEGEITCFNITRLLSEIEERLPSVNPDLKGVALRAQKNLLSWSYPLDDETRNRQKLRTVEWEVFCMVAEALRCCGIAPAGWPQPPDPDESLVLNLNPIPCFFEVISEKGGQTA